MLVNISMCIAGAGVLAIALECFGAAVAFFGIAWLLLRHAS